MLWVFPFELSFKGFVLIAVPPKAQVKLQKFDVFLKKTKEGWRFDRIVEATTANEAKMVAMQDSGITNPNRVSVYLRR